MKLLTPEEVDDCEQQVNNAKLTHDGTKVSVYVEALRDLIYTTKVHMGRNELRKLTERQELLIATLNPTVLGADLVTVIQTALNVQPRSFKKGNTP